MEMHLPRRQLQDMPCFILVMIWMGFIIRSTEIYCTNLLFPNLDPLICKNLQDFSDINVKLESIICEGLSPLREITYHLKIICRDRDGELETYRIKQVFIIVYYTTFTTLYQVSASMYADLFGIKKCLQKYVFSHKVGNFSCQK